MKIDRGLKALCQPELDTHKAGENELQKLSSNLPI